MDNGAVPPTADLEFAFVDDSKKILWGALLEKAWAKVKGNYDNIDGGFVNTGMRALAGVPVFSYKKTDYQTDAKITELYNILKAADDANYVIGFGTDGNGNDQENNSCNMAMSHAYTILSVFELDSTKVILARNPWGATDYKNTEWDKDSAKWNDAAKVA